jgi:HAD superfamily hydrolase (TIGR01549 family)
MRSAEIYSFDVFDTVITRITAEPGGIFGLIEQKLINGTYEINIFPYVKNNFAEIRIHAEQIARKTTTREEILIDNIYDVIAVQHNISKENIQKLIDIEIQEEINSIYGIPETIEKIKNIRSAGKRIIFISDTYLPIQVIRKMLIKANTYEINDRLYISSDIGYTKRTGNLFKYILENEKCSPEEMFHTGDDFDTDIKPAKKLGIFFSHFQETKLNRYEKILLGSGEKRFLDLQGQLTAGLSRLARLNTKSSRTNSNNILSQIGANIAGPVLVPFVIWILINSEKLKLKKLFFISRDGQILLEIAKLFNKQHNVELTYLYGSRQAWHLASVLDVNENIFEWVLLQDVALNLQIITSRLGIDIDKFINNLNEISGKKWYPDTIITATEINELKKYLLKDKIKNMILIEANKRRNLLIKYLEQEKFFDSPNKGIVDMGWHGNMQASLENVISQFSDENTFIGWYFGLVNPNKKVKNKMYSFFSSDNSNDTNNSFVQFINFLEIFTTGDHGTTIAYQETIDGSIKPVLKDEFNPNLTQWGLSCLRDGILIYARLYEKHLFGNIKFDFNKYQTRILNCLNTLVHTPTIEEVNALGSYLFTSDQSERELIHFAPKFSIFDSLRRFITGRYPMIYWVEGTYLKSGLLSSIILTFSTHRIDLLSVRIKSCFSHKILSSD